MVAFISIVGKDCVYLSTHHEMGNNTSAEEREKNLGLPLYKCRKTEKAYQSEACFISR